MCVTATAKRRRSQAKKKYMHLAPQDRPHYRQKPKSKHMDKYKAAIARGWKG